jgi:hypothetical protein
MRALALSLLVACGGAPVPKSPAPLKTDVLSIVIEGECERLRASVLENVVLVHAYGRIGRWTGSDIAYEPSLSRDIRNVGWIEGRFPDNAWLLWSQSNQGDHAMRWQTDHWEPVWGEPQTNPLSRFRRTPNGAWGMTFGGPTKVEGNRVHLPHATEVGVPAPMDAGPLEGASIIDVAVRPNGDAFVLVEREDRFEMRRLREGKPPIVEPLAITSPGTVTATATKAFVNAGEQLAVFDGAKWTMRTPGFGVRFIDEAPDGTVWLAGEAKILRGDVDVTPHVEGLIQRFAGASKNAPHVIVSGSVLRWQNDRWTELALPRVPRVPESPLIAEYVVVKDPGEVWVETVYDGRDHLAGRHYALLKTGPAPAKPIICGE